MSKNYAEGTFDQKGYRQGMFETLLKLVESPDDESYQEFLIQGSCRAINNTTII